MILKIIIGTSTTLVLIASIALIVFIMIYLKSKPIGMQTLLDLTSMDNAIISIFVVSIIHFIIWASLFKEQVNYSEKVTLVVMAWFFGQLCLTSMLVTIFVKSILIFDHTKLSDVPDEKAIKWSRIAILIITSFACFADQITVSDTNPILVIMTGDENSVSPVGPGLGTAITIIGNLGLIASIKLRLQIQETPDHEDIPVLKKLIWPGIYALTVAFLNVLTGLLHIQELDFIVILGTFAIAGILGPMSVIGANQRMRAKFYGRNYM